MMRRNGSRRRRGRRTQISESPLRTAVVGVVGLVLLLGVIFGALRSPNGVPAVSYTRVFADVPDVGNLRVHNEVRIAGIQVGQVLEREVQGDGARLQLQLDPDIGPLPADSTVAIRGRGLLGQRFLEIVPGKSDRALRAGATIRGGAEALTPGVPETLDTFDAATRSGLGDTVGELGRGLFARGGGLNDTLRIVAPTGKRFEGTFDELLRRPGSLERVLPAAAATTTGLSSARRDLSRTFPPAATTSETFAERAAQIQGTLDDAPSALDTATVGLTRGTRLLASARRLAAAAEVTLPGAPGGLDATTALLRTSREPLRGATPLVREARQTVPEVLRLTDTLRPALPRFTTLFNEVKPVTDTVGEYGCDVYNFGTVWRSFLGYGVPGGGKIGPLNSIRVTPLVTPNFVLGSGPALTSLIKNIPYTTPCQFSRGLTYDSGFQPILGDPKAKGATR